VIIQNVRRAAKCLAGTALMALTVLCGVFTPAALAHTPNTCASTKPAPGFPSAAPGYQRQFNTIAHRLLDTEDGAGEMAVTPDMYAILDALISEARETLKPYPDGLSALEADRFAEAALRQIDCILLRHGFVYPGHGQVLLLSDGLAPVKYANAKSLNELKNQIHNRRRRAFIAARGSGPFYVADCDIAAFITLAIAEVMHYPLKLVDIPQHKFVRWEFGPGRWTNFETMDGFTADNAYYRRAWHFPARLEGRAGMLSLSEAETLAYYDALIAMAWSWRGDDQRMAAYYERSMQRDSMRTFAANNLAWYYAATPKPGRRDGAKAVMYAQRAVALLPSSENLDTLACARAQAGDYTGAIREGHRAAAAGHAQAGIKRNLALFARKKTCIDPGIGRDPAPFRPRAHTMPTVSAH
jgi:hypothetical protein